MDVESLRDEVEAVLKKAPSSGGAQRDVWFLGDDLVVKKDQYEDDHYCRTEYENWLSYADRLPTKINFGREKMTVRLPDMAMLGDYIVAQRVKGKHLGWSIAECDEQACMNAPKHCDRYRKRGHDVKNCWDCYTVQWGPHVEECRAGRIIRAVEWFASEQLALEDMHNENFLWDEDTKTAWLVDIAE